MAWDSSTYPAAMQNLTDAVRAKAIEIANLLVGDGYEADHAVLIAIAQSGIWAADHDQRDANTGGKPLPARNLHVVPHPRGWGIRRAHDRCTKFVFETQEEAKTVALRMAQIDGVPVIVHGRDGQIAGESRVMG